MDMVWSVSNCRVDAVVTLVACVGRAGVGGSRRPPRGLCPFGTAHGPCPRRRVDRIPSVPGAVMGRSPNAAERMDARELPTVKNVPVLLSCRKDVEPTSLRLNVRLCCLRPEFFVHAMPYADACRVLHRPDN